MKLDNTYGNNCRSVALSTVLNYYGYPFSEAMCFGLGGAYNFITSDIECGVNKSYTVVSGNMENDFFNISDLLDLDYQMLQPSSEKELKNIIFNFVQEKTPVIAKVSINKYLRELHSTATNYSKDALEIFKLINSSAGNHVTIVNNIGEHKVSLYEPNMFDSVIVSWKSFYKAMSPTNRTLNHPARTLHIIKPKHPFSQIEGNMEEYIVKAIKNNMEVYLNETGNWGGLKSIKMLPKTLCCIENSKKMMINAKIFRFFCDITTGGGFYRRLYANFLKEANKKYLHDDFLNDIAKSYNKISKQWSSLAKLITESYNQLDDNKVQKISNDIMDVYKQEKEAAERLIERMIICIR